MWTLRGISLDPFSRRCGALAFTGKDEVRYNSRTDEVVLASYTQIAASIGKPLAVITVSPEGKIITREIR